jgi:hypothetical protein
VQLIVWVIVDDRQEAFNCFLVLGIRWLAVLEWNYSIRTLLVFG